VLLHQWMPDAVIVVVCDGLRTQEHFEQDIATWLRMAASPSDGPALAVGSGGPLLFYPDWEILPHESRLPHVDVISDRLATLVALRPFQKAAGGAAGAAASPPIIVTSVQALMQRTFGAEEIRQRTRVLRRGDTCDPLDFIEWLEDQGYEPEAQVTQKGELALRGGILDVFPLTNPWPVRLEFFGDELESVRCFDPVSQISRAEIEAAVFAPAGELGMLKRKVESAAPGESSSSLASLVDHLPPATVFLLCEPEGLSDAAGHYAAQVPPEDPFYLGWEQLRGQIQAAGMCQVELRELADVSPLFASLEAFRPLGASLPELQVAEQQRHEFLAQIHRWLRQGYQVSVFCNNEGERQRFSEIWAESGFGNIPETAAPMESGAPGEQSKDRDRAAAGSGSGHLDLLQGTLSRGFLFEEGRLVVVTDAEIFGRYRVSRPRRLRSVHAQATASALEINFADLKEGDYVVHIQYGIGRYLGLQVLPTSPTQKKDRVATSEPAVAQECLVIEYAPRESDLPPPKLYVPVTEAHLVSKYVGAGKARPALNTLGGTRWFKAKAQAEKAVRDLAGELLAIQAARASLPGHAFPPDTVWQREFEGSFLFEETPDQLRAIQETKRDLETPQPMDRLICGDVGFGKTEVALRAAFKVVMGGKQAAILVPTTVLAQQHYHTFRERMADYPVRVALLSRFRTRREQGRILGELAAGSVDIVIGTHRLLQDDIEFKDLGLVVIDEEQRFGVLHKEKFKRLRQLVDVLTLSATPIPRTLYLALTGARDMSTLETPPQDRLPVATHVVAYDERIIRDAIRRELNRQGQVFFLHNRIDTIDTVGQRLRALVPEARIAIGHGQMKSDELEEVMAQFVDGEVEVLLSTTIIESGLDIPNANTIIIDRADRFGLGDLYQLRGRVGRYKHQAYAYFLLPRHAALLADARRRISAIKQYSSLGSGFKIALRDLEIRGAGNLLGVEQSGQITAVGFELYCQLLKQSIQALKGEPVQPRVSVELRLDFLDTDPMHPKSDKDVSRRAGRSLPEDIPLNIRVPREVATFWSQESPETESDECPADSVGRVQASAVLPMSYVSEQPQRIDIYRKLAQANDRESLGRLRSELKDRFGPLPPAADLLLQLAALKILAAAKGVTGIETKGNKLMLTRNQAFVMMGGRFPRLSQQSAKGKLQEIQKLLLAF
jgi:transcription-repair coupling factor (superfamily II helicase)